jgi:hypothetical protein
MRRHYSRIWKILKDPFYYIEFNFGRSGGHAPALVITVIGGLKLGSRHQKLSWWPVWS